MSRYFELIQNNQVYSPYFSNGFSNHLPMVMYSTKQMGGSEEVLEYQASELRWEYYHKKYNLPFEKPAQSQGRINNANWNELKGDYGMYPDYLEWIREEKVIEDKALLQTILMELKHYQTAALFHAMIRFSMGFDDDHHEEIEIALAYWLSSAGDRERNVSAIYGETYIEDLNALLNDFKQSVNFVSLHYFTGFVAISRMPYELKEAFLPLYAGLLRAFVQSSGFENTESEKKELDDAFIQSAKEVAFKSVDDHVVKGIYALLELNKDGRFDHLKTSISALMKTKF